MRSSFRPRDRALRCALRTDSGRGQRPRWPPSIAGRSAVGPRTSSMRFHVLSLLNHKHQAVADAAYHAHRKRDQRRVRMAPASRVNCQRSLPRDRQHLEAHLPRLPSAPWRPLRALQPQPPPARPHPSRASRRISQHSRCRRLHHLLTLSHCRITTLHGSTVRIPAPQFVRAASADVQSLPRTNRTLRPRPDRPPETAQSPHPPPHAGNLPHAVPRSEAQPPEPRRAGRGGSAGG